MSVPFVCERLGRFDCVFQGVLYESVGGSLSEAFVVWCNLVKEQGSILYGSHVLSLLVSVMFPPESSSSESSVVDPSGGGGGMFLSYE